MTNKEGRSLGSWFGEKKAVRLMLLAALLTLGVLHFQWLIRGIVYMWNIAKPLLLGTVVAYILEIVVKRVEKYFFPNSKKRWLIKSRRWICILLSAVFLLSMLTLLVYTVIPGLTQAVTLLARELPVYFSQARQWGLDTFRDVPQITEYLETLEFDWPSIQERVISWAVSGMNNGGLLSSTVSVISAVTGQVANFLISVIFAIFLLLGKNQLRRQFDALGQALFSPDRLGRLRHVLSTANRCFSGFIVGQTLNGLILGVCTWLGMRIFGMPYALVVGVLSGTFSLIPIIGGYVGAALGTFLVFTAAPGQALWFLLFIVTLQTISGNVIYPRLLGNSVGIPGLWVLAAITVGGGVGGISGMLLAVPLTATLYALIHEWVKKKNAAITPV